MKQRINPFLLLIMHYSSSRTRGSGLSATKEQTTCTIKLYFSKTAIVSGWVIPFIRKAELVLVLASSVNQHLSNTYGHLYLGPPLSCLMGTLFLPTKHNLHLGARWTLWMDNVIPSLFCLNYEWHLTMPDLTELCASPTAVPALNFTNPLCRTPLVLSFLPRCDLLTSRWNYFLPNSCPID